MEKENEKENSEIASLLRVMLAQALNQQDRNLVAQLYETIRSLSNLDEVRKLKIFGEQLQAKQGTIEISYGERYCPMSFFYAL